jgi:pimeloyl-ACP methyl ester carboxylesterase
MIWDGKATVKFVRAKPETAWPHDVNCACSISFVPVAKRVKLEVLDWGGTGRPLILLAGLGDSSHVLDGFAHKLAATYHVYGITRRAADDSSAPAPTEANYNADRLGDDVIAVIDSLHLTQRPVLVGHSIAGEELSSVGSRHPEKVAGLIYLDAGYEYAIYDRTHFDIDLDTLAIRTQLDELLLNGGSGKAASELLAELPEFEKELAARQKETAGVPDDPPDDASDFGPEEAIRLGERKYTEIKVPVLAIFANPHKLPPAPPEYNAAARAALAKFMSDHTSTFVHAFQTDVPTAEVVSIPNADHYVFQSNEAQVLSAMNTFLAKLPN